MGKYLLFSSVDGFQWGKKGDFVTDWNFRQQNRAGQPSCPACGGSKKYDYTEN